jgi:hypothetical protein
VELELELELKFLYKSKEPPNTGLQLLCKEYKYGQFWDNTNTVRNLEPEVNRKQTLHLVVLSSPCVHNMVIHYYRTGH